jgi:hypothetical protein
MTIRMKEIQKAASAPAIRFWKRMAGRSGVPLA